MTNERYQRNYAILDFGRDAQAALQSGRVAVVGAGGLGSPLLFYLAAAGVGYLRVIDSDTVEESNLNRQILHATGDVGAHKSVSARASLTALNPEVTVEAVSSRLTRENALNLLGGVDVVVNASDNFPTQYLLDDVCAQLDRPLVWGTIVELCAQVTVFDKSPALSSSQWPSVPRVRLRDLHPCPPPVCHDAPVNGVLGAACGVAGSFMAIEVIKLLTGRWQSLCGEVLLIDARTASTRKVPFGKESK